ncbi:hypothetical protein PHYSODRAFT_321709 [Phytophthora sojae]|uniref:Uncharacterized protein n=1 Tax=Phytophthora sojae (strain P6497) TaxID=1094619 RepID=G4YFA0_PHYSP|nr:hypothetical protein PHYSODRAFT_321709 [Phytophthora sojae]EGZ28004.1 hypothetical protein PHYSODRAFT_321709 [Phytophthora sojae]|eukprot:XP_009515279.1 hypothetical protein PHYSODRAFT_321709 [Phytophthora sojae]
MATPLWSQSSWRPELQRKACTWPACLHATAGQLGGKAADQAGFLRRCALLAAGPCVLLDRLLLGCVCCWAVCAARPCVLLGRVCCWALCATGPCVAADAGPLAAGLCALLGRVLGCACALSWRVAQVAEDLDEYGAVDGCDLPAPMELVRLSARPSGLEDRVQTPTWASSEAQEWRKGGIGCRVDDFAFVVALAKLVKEDGKVACFVTRTHGFDDRANGYSL